MAITSFAFVLFCFLTLLIYYLIPKKAQWVVLLVSSIFFYLTTSTHGALFVLITASTIYLSARWMQHISDQKKQYLKEHKGILTKEEKAQYKNRANGKRKAVFLLALLVNLGILCFFKYCHFAIDTTNSVLVLFGATPIEDTLKVLIPLGISFYTFQSVGYLVDVYWEYYPAEKNYFKTLLFVSFFPQMTQGPISNFQQLSSELFSEHTFTYENYSRGFQRMLWGFAKKMVIANTFAPWVKDVFANYPQYHALTALMGIFMYSIQIYADFSGYMDIMCGFCQMLGIRLAENFERPYFSKSIAEYWRKWHMTMGTWFKKYIYFPIAMSTWSRKLAKKTAWLGKHFSETFPATIALLVTWAATGLWHGANWAYVVWGLVNGAFLILSLWLEPLYVSMRKTFRVDETRLVWRLFLVIRTFILVSFIKVIPEVGTLSQGLGLIGRCFSGFSGINSLGSLFPFVDNSVAFWRIGLVFVLLFIWIFFSFIQRKQPVREYFSAVPVWVRVSLLLGLFFVIFLIGVPSSLEGDFLYAAF